MRIDGKERHVFTEGTMGHVCIEGSSVLVCTYGSLDKAFLKDGSYRCVLKKCVTCV